MLQEVSVLLQFRFGEYFRTSNLLKSLGREFRLTTNRLSRWLGADIFCTVGSQDKIEYLNKTFGIPRNKIFHSRDLTFRQDVLEATNGRGVDVVLNSLSGELLHGSWDCVAEYGTMIEIGKRDLIGKGSLALHLFEQNRSYIGVDFGRICAQRPRLVTGFVVSKTDSSYVFTNTGLVY